MFQSKKPNSSRGVRHARKLYLRTDASRDTRCSRALNTQLPLVKVERAIHHVIEGFHDAVRNPYALRPGRHVGFFWNNKICFNFVSILFEKIKLTVSERTYIIVHMV